MEKKISQRRFKIAGDGSALATLLTTLILVSACAAGPPVQEMSDARQAIAVAREAGASEHAPDALRAAETYLDSALRNLAKKEYEQARIDAIEAKKDALNALAVAAGSLSKTPNR